jgi:hypothetical protein
VFATNIEAVRLVALGYLRLWRGHRPGGDSEQLRTIRLLAFIQLEGKKKEKKDCIQFTMLLELAC